MDTKFARQQCAVVAGIFAVSEQRFAGSAMLVVLLGTLLPLELHKQLGPGQYFGGEPFFNFMFTWLMVPFARCLVSALWYAGDAIAHVKSAIC